MNNRGSCFTHLLGFILLLVGFFILPLYIQDRQKYEGGWEEDRFVVLSFVLMIGGASLLVVGRNARREASRNDESEEE